MGLSEKQIEGVFEVFYKDLISDDLQFVGRQVTLPGSRLRVDLLFRDKEDRNVILELKKDAITREDVGQTLQYAGMIENSRVILVAPLIAVPIKKAFDHHGIDYLEFDLAEIAKLYRQIERNPKTPVSRPRVDIGKVIRDPLATKRKKDGNIAFKVTYVDSNWRGVCSNNLFEHNRTNRIWCGIQAEDPQGCRSKEWRRPSSLTPDNFPCFDSIAMKFLQFSPGVTHGPVKHDTPKRCLQAKAGKLALFTSREPGLPEDERVVFAIARIKTILPGDDFGFEVFRCDKNHALTFDDRKRPRFWNYYSNPNKPERRVWGTGLFRYVSDAVVRNLLKDLISDNTYSRDDRAAARHLLTIVE